MPEHACSGAGPTMPAAPPTPPPSDRSNCVPVSLPLGAPDGGHAAKVWLSMTMKASRGGGGGSKHRHLWAIDGSTTLTLVKRGRERGRGGRIIIKTAFSDKHGELQLT